MVTKQLEHWQGDLGNTYVDRNPIEDQIEYRVNFWQDMLRRTLCTPTYSPKSILEVGAGQGANLIALNNIYFVANTPLELTAVEPNEKARNLLRQNSRAKIIERDAFEIHADDYSHDLVFTMGVLIHIHPDDIKKAMDEIYRVSKRFVMCSEYFSPQLREIKYYEKETLWANDYGSLWMDNFKLRHVAHCFHWKRTTGMDGITTWVFEKVN